MPTKLMKQQGFLDKPQLVSYLVENPREVLEVLFSNHYILKYRNVDLTPIDEENSRGFVISPATAPKGTQIVASIKDVDLLQGLMLQSPLNIADFKTNFRSTILQAMQYCEDGEMADYLSGYKYRESGESQKIPEMENKLTGLIEIIEVAFKVSKPTYKDVRAFANPNHPN